MKKYCFEISRFLLLPFILLSHILEGTVENTCNLNEIYTQGCTLPSGINEHLPILCKYAKECSSAVEIGRNRLDATWGILQGLSESHSEQRSLLKIVTDYLTLDQLNLAKTLTEAHAIHFDFWQAKDLFIHIEPTDMLFLEIFPHLLPSHL